MKALFCKTRHMLLSCAWRVGTIFLVVAALTACTGLLPPSISTPLPAEYLPTAAALTMAALEAQGNPPSGQAAPSSPVPPSALPPSPASTDAAHTSPTVSPSREAPTTQTPAPATQTAPPPATEPPPPATMPEAGAEPSPSPQVSPAAETASIPEPRAGTVTATAAPPIPDARIQIFRVGDLSKIISPLEVSALLTTGEGKVARVELYGEDGRLLGRDVRTYRDIPWKSARLGVAMDFEISSAAELARLVVSAEDSYGRLIEVNSVKMVLLAQGMSEFNPPTGLQQRIIIEDPVEMALIQNGRLIVSGRAKPESDQPLRVMLMGEDGKILGQRLTGVSIPVPGDYGTFVAEVPYTVSDPTPALLVVFEEGGVISPITFLTSIHVLLAP